MRLLSLAIVVAIGTLLRSWGIGAKSLWFDEATSYSLLEFSPWEIIWRCADRRAVHPPGYFLVLKAWRAMWGDSEVALRSLALVCGMVIVLGTYLLIRELYHRTAPAQNLPHDGALLGAALVALSPLQIQLSQQVRGYTLAGALHIFSSWALLRAVGCANGRRTSTVAFAILGVLAAYVHHLAAFALIAQGLFAMLLSRPSQWFSRRNPAWPAIAVVSVGYVLPSIAFLFAQSQTIRHDVVWPMTWRTIPTETFYALVATFDADADPGLPVSVALLVILAVLLSIVAFRGAIQQRYVVCMACVPPLLLACFSLTSDRNVFCARYLWLAQLYWLSVVAIGIAQIPWRLERSVVIAAVLGLGSFGIYQNWDEVGPSARPGMRAAIAEIEKYRTADEPIVARSPFVFFGTLYYCRHSTRPKLCVREAVWKSQFAGEHLRPDDLVTPDAVRATASPGIWLVSSLSYRSDLIAQLDVPDTWKGTLRVRYEQDYVLEKPVTVEHFTVRQGDIGTKKGAKADVHSL